MRSRTLVLALALTVPFAFMIVAAVADDFVPFVIPAKTPPDSVLVDPSRAIAGAADRLVVRDGHFHREDGRVRLWGVNLSFSANWPSHEDAAAIANRLAAAGVNSVRCHHMDTSRYPRGLWARDGESLDPRALDGLDFFIDQLARRGIYVDLNLHVGKSHSRALDLPETGSQYDKIACLFTPALIAAQKRYARELLDRVNPYRKTRYADDPAVAIVEITNENSFFMWNGEETLRGLPPYYEKILRGKFNACLVERYGSTKKLAGEWRREVTPLGSSLLHGDVQTIPSKDWNVEQHSGCAVELSTASHRERRGLRLRPTRTDGVDWHLQLKQGGFAVTAGEYYTVSFRTAAGGKSRRIRCGVGQAHSPWRGLGLSREVELIREWKPFRFGFVASQSDENARLSFSFGQSDGELFLADVDLRPGGQRGLLEGESLEAGSVALYGEQESPSRALDRQRFLATVEKSYFDDMRRFVKEELGGRALVTGTIVFGPLGLWAQSDMDFIDAHAYWQHPKFPRRPWDAGDWIVEQLAMTDHPEQATLFRLAAERLARKPFTVTEYNHPAPMDSQAECVPMIAAFAAAQDWDGVWLYSYSHNPDGWERGYFRSFFDIWANPAKWGFMRAGAALYRHGGLAPLGGLESIALAPAGSDVLTALAKLHARHDRDMFAALASSGALAREGLLESRCIATLGPAPRSSRATPGVEKSPMSLHWTVESGRGVFAASGEGAIVATGRAGRFAAGTAGVVRVDSPDFAAVTATPLDGESLAMSRRVLVTACGRCENDGMEFSEDRRTVGRGWGRAPARIEAVSGVVTLPGSGWTCRAIGADGRPSGDAWRVEKSADGRSVLELSPKRRTMWYLATR